MDIGKKRSSPKEQEISCKKRKVCNVGNKQITATASMKPDLSKDVIGLQSFLSMHQEGPTCSKRLPDRLSTKVKSKVPVTSESIKKYFTPLRTSNKVPLSVISLYKDTPVLSGENMLNDKPVESCIKVDPKDYPITLTNEGVPINVTHPTGILLIDCDPFDIGLHVNTKKSVEEKVELIHKLWIPRETCFPKNKSNKRFNHHWIARYPWLCYSKYKDGAFCLWFVLFDDHAKGGRFVCSAFTDWKHT